MTPNSRPDAKPRVLAAEDEPATAVALKAVLRHFGCDTDLARDGREAVEMWEKGSYDLILMDVRMPRVDGLAATREIRDREKAMGGHIPIVALTATTFPDDCEACKVAGMDACIGKPVDLSKDALIRELLNNR